MWNVLLDPLPVEWNGYPIDSDFQIGIQISQCMEDDSLSNSERFYIVKKLLFPDENNQPGDMEIPKAVKWYLTDYVHDHYDSKDNDIVMDWDIDQWRIYAAFVVSTILISIKNHCIGLYSWDCWQIWRNVLLPGL